MQSLHAVDSTFLGGNLQCVVSELSVCLQWILRCVAHDSPTMGGLYFWVCKMKPEIPMLGCESLTVVSRLYLLKR